MFFFLTLSCIITAFNFPTFQSSQHPSFFCFAYFLFPFQHLFFCVFTAKPFHSSLWKLVEQHFTPVQLSLTFRIFFSFFFSISSLPCQDCTPGFCCQHPLFHVLYRLLSHIAFCKINSLSSVSMNHLSISVFFICLLCLHYLIYFNGLNSVAPSLFSVHFSV